MTNAAKKLCHARDLALMLVAVVCLAQPGFSSRGYSQSAQSTDVTSLSAQPPSGFTPLETVLVPVDGTSVQSLVALKAGVIYKLRASGTAVARGSVLADAEYAFDANDGSVINNQGNFSLDVDLGIGVNDPLNSNNKFPFWGNFDPTHTYTINFVGQGLPISLNYHGSFQADSSRSLTVEIFRPRFDLCLQDDSNNDTLLISSTTGEFLLCSAAVPNGLSGVGALTKKGCYLTFQGNAASHRLTAKVDLCLHKSTAALQLPPGKTICTIVDRDSTNNSCACVGPVP